MVYDSLTARNLDPHSIQIENELRCSCFTASSKRKAALKKLKEQKVLSDKEIKQGSFRDEITEISRQVREVNSTILELEKQASSCYDEAEKPGAEMMMLVTKGNSLWKTADQKRELIHNLNKAISKLVEEIQKC